MYPVLFYGVQFDVLIIVQCINYKNRIKYVLQEVGKIKLNVAPGELCVVDRP